MCALSHAGVLIFVSRASVFKSDHAAEMDRPHPPVPIAVLALESNPLRRTHTNDINETLLQVLQGVSVLKP